MRKFALREGDMYVSDDMIGELFIKDDRGAQQYLELFVLAGVFGSNPEFRDYIDLYGRLYGLGRYGVLNAHGDTNGEWVYFDSEKQYAVQGWINSVDGRYAGLLLWSCNPGSHTPYSKRSVLAVPDRSITPNKRTEDTSVIFSLLVPRIGEVDSYIINYEVERLRKELGKRV